jgi:hypothetical protein
MEVIQIFCLRWVFITLRFYFVAVKTLLIWSNEVCYHHRETDTLSELFYVKIYDFSQIYEGSVFASILDMLESKFCCG